MPRVAVVTPTWGAARYGSLLARCIPSVEAQSFTDWEHLIVSDGPDPALRQLGNGRQRRYLEMPEHIEPHSWGAGARNVGAASTSAEYIAYLDSDNAFRPEHLALLVAALDGSGADFAYSRLEVAGEALQIGAEPPAVGQIDSSLIVHRREALDRLGLWPVAHIYAIDWEFISGWLERGARWAHVPVVTVDYWRN